MRHNDEPNPLRLLFVTIAFFWALVYCGLKMFGII